MSKFTNLPPELICEIAHYLSVAPDVQNLALTSHGLRLACTPELYREVVYDSPSWKALLGSDTLPSWSSHIHILTFTKLESDSPPIDFRPFLNTLAGLKALREIHASSCYAKLARNSGVEELAHRVPSLRVFKWQSFIDIDKTGEILLRNLEELELLLESGFGGPDTSDSQSWWMLDDLDDFPDVADPLPQPSKTSEDEGASPFNSLAGLSEAHPRLRTLTLQLNYPMESMGSRDLGSAAINPLLSNTFPHLTHFSLKGLLQVPGKSEFYAFVESHPQLRSFTYHSCDGSLIFPKDAFLHLEYLEGPGDLLAAICDTSDAPRLSLTEICGIDSWRGDSVYAARVFPKLPNLREVFINYGQDVTPEWLRAFGESCPKLVNLQIHDPRWMGSIHDFSRAFSAFKCLKYLDTSRSFGCGEPVQTVIVSAPRADNANPLALVQAAAQAAPALTEIWWGNESSGCVMEALDGRRIVRGEDGSVLSLRSVFEDY